MKRLLTIILVCITTVCVSAQTIDELLAHYVQLRTEGKEALDIMLELRGKYDKQKAPQQAFFRESVMMQITNQLRSEHKDVALSLISLYKSICPDNDATLNNLYYAEGCIHAENGDTTSLKFCIKNLERNADASKTNAKEDITFLKAALNKITRKTRVMNELNGFWISNQHTASESVFKKINLPMQTAVILPSSMQNGSNTDYPMDMMLIDLQYGKDINHCQWFIPYAEDSIYVCWSNEKLQTFDPNVSTSLRHLTAQSSNLIAASMIDRHSSMGDKLKATAIGGVFEGVMNGIFDMVFTPTKKVWVTELRLRVVNDYEMSGTLKFTQSQISGNGIKDKYVTNTIPITFWRWSPSWPIQFINSQLSQTKAWVPWTPAFAFDYLTNITAYLELNYNKNKLDELNKFYVVQKNMYEKAKNALNGSHSSKDKAIAKWNLATFTQMVRLHNQRLYDLKLANGEDDANLKQFLTYPNHGVSTVHIDTTDPIYKKVPFEQGIEITEIETGSFQVAEFKKGDIIGSIDGKPMSYHEDLVTIMHTHKVGDEVEVEYVEKGSKKPQKVKMTLY